MNTKWKITIWIVGGLIAFCMLLYFYDGPVGTQEDMTYGVSFSTIRSDAMNLNWKDVYNAIIKDLKVKHIRIAAYWTEIEPTEGKFDFSKLDYEMELAKENNVKIILAIGRRLPGWPECHEPDWAMKYSQDEQQAMVDQLVGTIVNRYKNNPALDMWQVENEPFFDVFTRARNLCPQFDSDDFHGEVAIVEKADPNHKVLVTDGGELGTWLGAYKSGDVFGTSMYLYVWNEVLGYLRYPITPAFFRIKHGFVKLLYGDKPSIVIELQSEPWMPEPLTNVPIDQQLQKFNIKKMDELISYPYKSGFNTAYLWGAEWWYWMKNNGHPEFWNRAKQLYK